MALEIEFYNREPITTHFRVELWHRFDGQHMATIRLTKDSETNVSLSDIRSITPVDVNVTINLEQGYATDNFNKRGGSDD